MDDINNREDILDVRDIIERYEYLQDERRAFLTKHSREDWDGSPEGDELDALKALLDSLEDNGGDHQWRGAWFPVTLIRDSYFEDYAEELAEDIGAINREASWPNNCIDWERAARELQQDYSSVEFDGVTYWYR